MRLKVNIGDLVDSINQVFATTDRRATSSANVYIQAVRKADDQQYLYIYSTNLSSETLTKISAVVEDEGKILINPDQLLGGLQGRPRDGEVVLTSESEGKKVKVTYGKARFNIASDPEVASIETQLKRLPFNEPVMFKVNGRDMVEFIKKSQFCIPTDNTGQGSIFSCLHITDNAEGYSAQATDNSIATSISIKAKKLQPEPLGSLKLPQSSLGPLNKLLAKRHAEVISLVKHGNNKIVFKFGDTMYGTILISGKYPNLQPIFDKKPAVTFNIDREAFKSSLDRSNAFRNIKGYVDLELKKEELVVSTKSASGTGDSHDVIKVDIVEGTLPTNIDNQGYLKISVGIDYLSSVTSAIKTEKIKIGVTNSFSPIFITDENEDVSTKYVLMGVKSD